MISPKHPALRPCLAWATTLLWLVPTAASAQYPPPTTEISAERPLFLFAAPVGAGPDGAPSAAALIQAWSTLDAELQPFSALALRSAARDARTLLDLYLAVLPALQEAGVPVWIPLPAEPAGARVEAAALEDLFDRFTVLRGVELDGLRFNAYAPPGGDGQLVELRHAWVAAMLESAARFGRLALLPFEGLDGARLIANDNAAGLREKMRACAPYVVPTALQRGPHTLPAGMAALGLWLEGHAAQWGVAPDLHWHRDARFGDLGIFGEVPGAVPGGLYRAMALNGAMTGARVYRFDAPDDLWFGARPAVWQDHLAPLLRDLVDGAIIAREEFVRRQAPVAYQLNAVAIPPDFLPALRDLDAAHDVGALIQAAYGVERGGQIPELVPNRSDRYWIPLLSPQAGGDTLAAFGRVLRSGEAVGPEGWDHLLDPLYTAAGSGEAFVARVGRAYFVLHSRENIPGAQGFTLPAVPAPVRGLTATREAGVVVLAWPFREGDVSYTVWRRDGTGGPARQLARGLADRRFEDPDAPADQTHVYAVTALTSETEPYTGAVNPWEYRAISAVESRIAEEAVLTPVLATVGATPLVEVVPATVSEALPLWPPAQALDPAREAAVAAISAQVEALDRAVALGDARAATAVYAEDYTDPQGWGVDYVLRAWQWLFERGAKARLHRQARAWDWDSLETSGEVGLRLYLRVDAEALTDPSGQLAGIPIALPRGASEVTLRWAQRGGVWRVLRSEPAFPNLRDLLADLAGPYAGLPPGPDAPGGGGTATVPTSDIDLGPAPVPDVTRLPAPGPPPEAATVDAPAPETTP
jgi:hypothetical protein